MIPLMPVHAVDNFVSPSVDIERNKDLSSFAESENVIFTKSAKAAIRVVSESLGLRREDEVCISTTSGSTFVSTCVTGTLFNYAKVSRVITEKTKLVFVIHEFGFKNSQVHDLRRWCDKTGIPMLEDCAHFFPDIGSEIGGFGDFVIHSIPKSLPIEMGGVLRLKLPKLLESINSKYVSEEVNAYFQSQNRQIGYLNQKRREIYKFYARELQQTEVFRFDDLSVPFVYGFVNKDYIFLQTKLENYVELGRNYVDQNVLIPTNPFAPFRQHQQVAEILKSYL